jgi:hypothetical protein
VLITISEARAVSFRGKQAPKIDLRVQKAQPPKGNGQRMATQSNLYLCADFAHGDKILRGFELLEVQGFQILITKLHTVFGNSLRFIFV